MTQQGYVVDGRQGAGSRLALLMTVLPLIALQGCGDNGSDGPAKSTPHVVQQQAIPMPAPPVRQAWQMPAGPRQTGNGWTNWSQPPSAPASANGGQYPQARNPWQGPPVGFGRDVAQGQLIWPQQQATPAPPTFRPWEEEQAEQQQKQQATLPPPQLVAPYDRPLGSSRRGGQQIYAPGSGYPYAPGYGAYGPSYGGYSPYGWGYGPYNNGPFGMGMFPFW